MTMTNGKGAGVRFRGCVSRALCALLAVALLAPWAWAQDTLTLRDGTVYEGTIEREVDGWIYFRYRVAGIERVEFFSPDRIASLARADSDEASPSVGATPSDEAVPPARRADERRARPARPGVPRIAVISLGEMPGKDMVGIFMTAHSVRQTIPMLEKAGVTDVVFRVDSGGGALLEIQKMSDLIHEEFKPRFRTVGWIENAISAAAMSVHCLEEHYFTPQGTYGACTAWFGQLSAVKGRDLDAVLFQMEKISARGGHDYRLMRSMQIMEPLSASVDENGDVQFFQSLEGDVILNQDNRILTLNATQANEIRFSGGTAATTDELARLMGYTEYEFIGETIPGIPYPVSEADKFLRDFRERVYNDQRRTNEFFDSYQSALAMAQGAAPEARGKFIGRARRALGNLERMVRNNPAFILFVFNLTSEEAFEDWMDEQEEMLRDLARPA